MAKAIIRMAKIKSMQRLAGTEKHNNRELIAANINPEETAKNELVFGKAEITQGVKENIDLVKKDMTKAIRKDAVLAQEYILNASPEFFHSLDQKTEDRWIEKNVEFLKNMYGTDNLVNVTAHRDESHLHLHAIVTPIYEEKGKKRLSAKHYTGGSSTRLRQLQTDYAESMSSFGLERGKTGEKVEYKDLEEYKRETADHAKAIKEIMDNPEQANTNVFNAQKRARQLEEENRRLKAQLAHESSDKEKTKQSRTREGKKAADKAKSRDKDYTKLVENIAQGQITTKELATAIKQTKEKDGIKEAADINHAIASNRKTEEIRRQREKNKNKEKGKGLD